MEGQEKPRVVLICCEGERTEPDYSDCVIRQRRINQSAQIVVVGDLGQHQALVDRATLERDRLCSKLDLSSEDIELWAVCDNDHMRGKLSELTNYAERSGVKVGFSNPCFEVFLLQHFKFSATNATGRQLAVLLSNAMKSKGVNRPYDKTDLSWLHAIIDAEPLILERAVQNSERLMREESTPYISVHLLLKRLLELAP